MRLACIDLLLVPYGMRFVLLPSIQQFPSRRRSWLKFLLLHAVCGPWCFLPRRSDFWTGRGTQRDSPHATFCHRGRKCLVPVLSFFLLLSLSSSAQRLFFEPSPSSSRGAGPSTRLQGEAAVSSSSFYGNASSFFSAGSVLCRYTSPAVVMELLGESVEDAILSQRLQESFLEVIVLGKGRSTRLERFKDHAGLKNRWIKEIASLQTQLASTYIEKSKETQTATHTRVFPQIAIYRCSRVRCLKGAVE